MKKSLKFIIPIVTIVILGGIFVVIFLLNKDDAKDVVPTDYIAVFHGGAGERTYETYIYKEDNGQANYGFKYINVESTTVRWGSSDWNHKVTKEGTFNWTDEAFRIAEENGAYSYVTIPNDTKTYTIEEFQGKFIMN